MEQKQKDALWAQYTKQTHRLGRVLSLITVALLLGAPFVIGALLGAYPDLGATARGFLSVGLVWTVSSVAEFLIYTPMLGAGGGYLAFITGNLINMKIPCAVNARDLAGVKTGTAENADHSDNLTFIGFAPYENPEIAVAVVIEYGGKGDAAKETAKAVFEAYFAETLQKGAKNAETTVTEGTE